MVRGCQKKIVYLKSTGSDVFDEAYFVVRETALDKISECDMVKEANRILEECTSLENDRDKKEALFGFLKNKTVPFLVGTVVGMIITILIK